MIVLTRDEEANIAACLALLDWADEVILVDSGSADDTIGRARAARPDLQVHVHPFTDFGQQRNWALDCASPRHEWVLFLDADERCTPACAEAIRRAIEKPGDCVGFFLCCRNWFLGRWIRHCTLYPSWQLRLLRAGKVRFVKEGHGQRETSDGPLGYLDEPYDHYPLSKGIADWIARHNRYSTAEVELIEQYCREPLELRAAFARDPIRRRRCLKRILARMGCRAVAQFGYTYVLRGGFLDGMAGLHYCLLRAAHEIHVSAKLAELRKSN